WDLLERKLCRHCSVDCAFCSSLGMPSRWTSFWSSRYRFLPLRLDLLIGSAGEAVTNRDPFRLVGGKFDGDPVEGLAVQFVQRGVELCGVIISALWHALLESGAGVVSEPEIGAASFTGKMAAADEEDARARAVVFCAGPGTDGHLRVVPSRLLPFCHPVLLQQTPCRGAGLLSHRALRRSPWIPGRLRRDRHRGETACHRRRLRGRAAPW